MCAAGRFFCVKVAKKTAKDCKAPVLSYFQTGYGKLGGRNPNLNEEGRNFHCMHVLVLQGFLRQHSTTSLECSQRAGFFFLCWHLPSSPPALKAHCEPKHCHEHVREPPTTRHFRNVTQAGFGCRVRSYGPARGADVV